MSYRDLDAAVERLAGDLAARCGSRPAPADAAGEGPGERHPLAGERIAILAPNVPALVVALFAAWRLDAVAVPLNARLREYEIGRILRDAEVSAVLSVAEYRGYSFASVLPGLLPQLPSVRLCRFLDPMGELMADPSGLPADGALAERTVERGDSDLAVDQIGLLLYTSGTTGAPKGALVTHARELAGSDQMADVLRLSPEDVCIFVVPISHAFGLTCLLSTIAAGSHAVMVEATFSPAPMLEAMREHSATILNGSPALFTSLLKAAPEGVPGLRAGFVAGSACPPHVLAQLDAAGACILNLFGMTEIGAGSCCRPDDPPQVRYTTSGRPFPGYEFRIAAETGEVQVRGPHITPGYYRQPEQTAQAFIPDEGDGPPWFRTGDLGSLDEDGYLRISGRAKEVVQVGGLNVFPAEVEGFLLTHPDVLQAAVVGVPHETMGEVLQAFVVARPGSDLAPPALLQYARARIAGYKLPYAITLVLELPLLSSGKPDRAALRAVSHDS